MSKEHNPNIDRRMNEPQTQNSNMFLNIIIIVSIICIVVLAGIFSVAYYKRSLVFAAISIAAGIPPGIIG